MSKEKLLAYHQDLAKALKELAKRRKLERNEAKIKRIAEELRGTGFQLKDIRERDSFDSENPDREALHPDCD